MVRFNWDTPLLISKHNPKTIYIAANVLFKSTDRGDTWETISPDLTRQIDRNKLKIMDKVWNADAVAKNASTSLYGNIVSLCESPLNENVIYVGTDDGLIQVTEDGGKNWTKIEKVDGLSDLIYVSDLFASQLMHRQAIEKGLIVYFNKLRRASIKNKLELSPYSILKSLLPHERIYTKP